jgi:hypothetical protein
VKLPKKFREDDIVILKKNHTILDSGGSIEFSKGHPFRIEKVIYDLPRNRMADGVYSYVILSTCVGEMPLMINMAMHVAQELLLIKPAAAVLYGDNNDKPIKS